MTKKSMTTFLTLFLGVIIGYSLNFILKQDTPSQQTSNVAGPHSEDQQPPTPSTNAEEKTTATPATNAGPLKSKIVDTPYQKTTSDDNAKKEFEQRLKQAQQKGNIDKNPDRDITSDDYNENTISSDWAESHTQEIYDTVNRIASKEAAWGMRHTIGKYSQFTKPRAKKIDDAQDTEWSQQKEYELTTLIQTHPLSADFALIKITCKQLMCEIFGTVYNDDSWHSIYQSLLKNANNIIPPWEANEELLMSKFKDGESEYGYVLCDFSA